MQFTIKWPPFEIGLMCGYRKAGLSSCESGFSSEPPLVDYCSTSTEEADLGWPGCCGVVIFWQRQKIKLQHESTHHQDGSFFFFRDWEWKFGWNHRRPLPVWPCVCVCVCLLPGLSQHGHCVSALVFHLTQQRTVYQPVSEWASAVCIALSPGNRGEARPTRASAKKGLM